MNKSVKIFAIVLVVLLILAFLVSRCSGPKAQGQTTPTPTSAYAATATLLASQNLSHTDDGSNAITIDNVTREDFSDDAGQWSTFRDKSGGAAINNGRLLISAESAAPAMSTLNTDTYKDVYVSVYATRVGGSADNAFGITCRSDGASNYYFGVATSDGYAAIGKTVGDKVTMLSRNGYVKLDNPLVDGKNLLTFECLGPELRLNINGRSVITALDYELTSGHIGLMAASVDGQGTQVIFDDLVLGVME
jgi:hypothetical protein